MMRMPGRLTLFLALLPVTAYAQDSALFADNIGNFFTAVFAGVLLAFAFQFILTNLGVAVGISMTDDVRDLADRDSSNGNKHSGKRPREKSASAGAKITSRVGMAMTLSMVISLFLASWLAVKLALIPSTMIGVTLGLIIWAGYLLLALYLDARILSSFTASAFNIVKSGFSRAAGALSRTREKNEADIIADAASKTFKNIENEIREEFNVSEIENKLDAYVRELKPEQIDYDEIHEHLAELLHDMELREQYTPDDPETTKKLFLEIAEKQPSLTGEDKQKLSNAFDRAKDALQTEGTRSDKAFALLDKLSPGNEQEAALYRERVTEYLRESGQEDLDPEQLAGDLDQILNNPRVSLDIIRTRLERFDRDTLKALIAAHDKVSESQAERYIAKAEAVLERLRSRSREMADSAKQRAGEIRSKAQSQATRNEVKEKQEVRKHQTEQAIADWFDRMRRPELRYHQIKYDVERILDEPGSTPAVLRHRLNRLNRQSLIALLSNNSKISREQAEHAVAKIEEARDDTVQRLHEVEGEVRSRIVDVRDEALREVEIVRQTGVAAAWWLFVSSILAGVASATGGGLALMI